MNTTTPTVEISGDPATVVAQCKSCGAIWPEDPTTAQPTCRACGFGCVDVTLDEAASRLAEMVAEAAADHVADEDDADELGSIAAYDGRDPVAVVWDDATDAPVAVGWASINGDDGDLTASIDVTPVPAR